MTAWRVSTYNVNAPKMVPIGKARHEIAARTYDSFRRFLLIRRYDNSRNEAQKAKLIIPKTGNTISHNLLKLGLFQAGRKTEDIAIGNKIKKKAPHIMNPIIAYPIAAMVSFFIIPSSQ